MSRERILEVVLTMLGAVLLLIAAVGKHPYGFYIVLRLVITVGAGYWAWRVYKAGLRAWTWVFVAVALLLNPFFPIRMQRAQWQPIDLCLGILLIGWSGYWLFRGTRSREAAGELRMVILWGCWWLWLPLLFFCLSKVLPGHMVDAIAKIMFGAYVVFVLAAFLGVFLVEGGLKELLQLRTVLTVVALLAALVVAGIVMRWTLEVCRAHIHPFVLSLTMMVVFTDVLACFVGKRPYRNKVKVTWLGLVCYLSFTLLLSSDVVRDKFGQRYIPGYYSTTCCSYYGDCEDATPDNPCSPVPTYRVNGHLSPTIEGVMVLYCLACIACPLAVYWLWQAAQKPREKVV